MVIQRHKHNTCKGKKSHDPEATDLMEPYKTQTKSQGNKNPTP